MKHRSMNNEIVFADVNSDYTEIKNKISENKDILIISFDYKSHKRLYEEKIQHEISDNFINDEECKRIQNYVYKFTYWFNENEFKNLLMFRDINIGRLFQDEILNFFVRFLKKIKEIENIFHQNKSAKFFADNELYQIIKFFTNLCTNISKSENKIHEFAHEEIKIGLKIGNNEKEIFVTKEKYLKFKKLSDRIINGFFSTRSTEEKNILFVEYDTNRFEQLFLKAREKEFQVIFYGRKKPPFWNFKTLKTIINSKCKIITEDFIKDETYDSNLLKSREQIKKQVQNLWKKQSLFEKFFTFEEKMIFDLVKPTLIELIENRLSDTIKEIELAYRMFEKTPIDYTVVINEAGFFQQIISSLSKKFGIKCIHMQEGYHWDSKDVNNNLISQGVYLHDAKKLWVWGEIDKKLAIENAHVSSEDIDIIGAPRYDRFFNQDETEGEYILLASSADPQPEEIEGLRVPKIEKYLSDILEICKIVSEMKEKLFVKLHPSPTQLTDLDTHTKKINQDIHIASSGEILDLLPNAKMLISIGISSAMIEAMILKKPVIYIPGIDYNWDDASIITSKGCINSNINNLKTDILKILNNEEFSNKIENQSNGYLSNLISYHGEASERFYELLKNDFN